MKLKQGTSQKILDYITSSSGASGTTPHELVDFFNLGERAIFKQLKKLYESGKIDKVGGPPKVFYLPMQKRKPEPIFTLSPEITKTLEENYLIITPMGERKSGVGGFSYWCQKQNLSIEKTAQEYVKTLKKYKQYKKGNYIDGTYKLKHTFTKVFIHRLYYLDFYSIERFGKTKLGWQLLYAKQSQNRILIKELTINFKNKIMELIKKLNIKTVGFIPPTLKREVQLMKEIERNLNLSLPTIAVKKAQTPIIVAQKTLSNLNDRIENAQKTIFIDDNRIYDNILLIDDAVGSGATMNETARKIREKGMCRGKIYGLAITGSFKGFEVISEI